MSLTITLTEITIKRIEINYLGQFVEVLYDVIDAEGNSWVKNQTAIFWVTLPTEPSTGDEWFQLPSTYLPTLVGLRNDAKAAIENRVLT